MLYQIHPALDECQEQMPFMQEKLSLEVKEDKVHLWQRTLAMIQTVSKRNKTGYFKYVADLVNEQGNTRNLWHLKSKKCNSTEIASLKSLTHSDPKDKQTSSLSNSAQFSHRRILHTYLTLRRVFICPCKSSPPPSQKSLKLLQ